MMLPAQSFVCHVKEENKLILINKLIFQISMIHKLHIKDELNDYTL